jgi:hypothetical protein
MGRWTQVHVFQTGSQNAATPYPRDNPPPPPRVTHRHRLTVAGPSPDGGASALSGLPSHVAPVSAAPPGNINAARGKYFHCHRVPRWREPRMAAPAPYPGYPPRSPGKRSATGGYFRAAVAPGGGPRMAAPAPYPGYHIRVAPVSAAPPGIFSGAVGPGGGNPGWRRERLIRATRLMSPR